MNSNNKTIRICFYLFWLLVSLLQANFTELLADEAYYWKYAQDLSWGYFDHPPVVAAIIKPGYAMLHNELGVRLLSVLMGTAFLYLLELLVQPQQLKRYYLTVASIGAFHFLGFLALPDMPLMLFSITFLWLYKKYLEHDNVLMALLLGVNTTLLLLSKYHGILVIGFVLLSNLQLLRRGSFWAIVAVSGLLFIPHVMWQFNHDFPSIKYHLSERSVGGYKIEYTLNYILSSILIFAPVAGIVLLWQSFKAKTSDKFERSLKWILVGVLSFFLVMTYKGRAEANWVAIAIIPAFVLGYRHAENKQWFPKLIRVSALISLPLIFLIRLYLITDFAPNLNVLGYARETLHNTRTWAEQLQEKAGKRPVVFMNKYQYAAWYEFYTGKPSISLNNRMGRKNQYNIWPDERNMQGQDIMLVPNYFMQDKDTLRTAKGIYQYVYIDNFVSASCVNIHPQTKYIDTTASALVDIRFTISTEDTSWDIQRNPNYTPVIHALILQGEQLYADRSIEFYITNAMLQHTDTYTAHIEMPAEAGTYELYLDVASGWLPASINSEGIKLQVH